MYRDRGHVTVNPDSSIGVFATVSGKKDIYGKEKLFFFYLFKGLSLQHGQPQACARCQHLCVAS